MVFNAGFHNYVREQEDKFYREKELKLVLEYTAMVYKQSEYVNCLKQAGLA